MAVDTRELITRAEKQVQDLERILKTLQNTHRLHEETQRLNDDKQAVSTATGNGAFNLS